jgi:hypothetical protein
MATLISAIVTNARVHLIETTASFWTDAELAQHAVFAIQDLWKAVIDNFQDYFLTIDETNVSYAANGGALTGVPADCFRVKSIEPRTLTDPTHVMLFRPLDFTHPAFIQARASAARDPGGTIFFYDILSTGSPTGTPTIRVAPPTNSAILLRLVYVPTLGALTAASTNPIPGHSDNAVMAWTIAYARAKEREDRSPDPEWLSLYSTEKQAILTAITPRQEDEPEFVESLFEPYWDWSP